MPEHELVEAVRRLVGVPVPELSAGRIVRSVEEGLAGLLPGVRAEVLLGPAASRPGAGDPDADGGTSGVAFALRQADDEVGVIRLDVDPELGLSATQEQDVQALADVAAACVINLRLYDDLGQSLDLTRDQALHDPLTRLPNRVLFLDRLGQAVQRGRRTGSGVAVLFLDLDRFKRVNDLYGHAVGDEVLVAFADRLRAALRPYDTAARLAGDEFVVLCEDLPDEAEAQLIGTRLCAALREPFELSAGTVVMTASIGIAYACGTDELTDSLLEDADAAMYQAKRRGGGRHQVLDLRERDEAHRRARIEQELLGAVARSELQPHYQPIVRSIDGQIVGAEALLRWDNPQRGLVPPSVFIPVAEHSGLITGIGRSVLAQSCADLRRWRDQPGAGRLDMAVNVSARQLIDDSGLVRAVASALDDSGLEPAALSLEITEDVFVENDDQALAVLKELKALGVQLALDDFGTGYSSLSYLKRFPIDIVKVDRTFVSDLWADSASHAIVYAIAELAHLLGMVVVAEGVEDADQLHEVIGLGCDYAQGYYFGRAVPPEVFAGLLGVPPTAH